MANSGGGGLWKVFRALPLRIFTEYCFQVTSRATKSGSKTKLINAFLWSSSQQHALLFIHESSRTSQCWYYTFIVRTLGHKVTDLDNTGLKFQCKIRFTNYWTIVRNNSWPQIRICNLSITTQNQFLIYELLWCVWWVNYKRMYIIIYYECMLVHNAHIR